MLLAVETASRKLLWEGRWDRPIPRIGEMVEFHGMPGLSRKGIAVIAVIHQIGSQHIKILVTG